VIARRGAAPVLLPGRNETKFPPAGWPSPGGPACEADPSEKFLEQARVAAGRCGVTRLGDITPLDRLGLPVWQAVRPAGRSLSVHQGKGATPAAARISALCEAIEAHCAEEVAADGPHCAFDDLPLAARAPEIGDYCKSRDTLPEPAAPLQWCTAMDFLTGAVLNLPFHLVSIDFTTGLPSAFERSSSGLGAGATEQDALRASFFEIIERDAVGEWRRLDPSLRLASSICLDTINFAWFQEWRDRFDSLGVDLHVFRIESIVGVPVLWCAIGGVEAFGRTYRRFYGTAAHGDPQIALFKALAEAIQSRLTMIAGVRDDILPADYAHPPPAGVKLPAGDGIYGAGGAELDWSRIEGLECGLEQLAARLADLGYPQIAVRRLNERLAGVAVTRVFIPGLGSLDRTRRPAS
jgi:ribosomal protein S12 methylthiotransferase accessory factor